MLAAKAQYSSANAKRYFREHLSVGDYYSEEQHVPGQWFGKGAADYVLFSDSAVKAATNNQQWYVTISRGRKGIKIFTCDKEQLRENITRLGDRPLALDAVAAR